MQNYLSLYPNLIKARINKFSQKTLAEEIGISQQDVSRYETGKIKAPINYLIDVSKVCNVSLDYITGLNEETEQQKNKMSDDDLELIESINKLTEREKGEIEYHVRQILEQHTSESEVG